MLLASLLLAAAAADAAVVSTSEPAMPERMAVDFNSKCDGHSLQVSGIGGGLPSEARPRLLVDQKEVSAPPSVGDFLSRQRSAYRLFATCNKGGTFYLRMYRISKAAGGDIEYAHYGIDLNADGSYKDFGLQRPEADTFWYK